MRWMTRFLLMIIVLGWTNQTQSQTQKPFIMPVAGEAGLNTWMFGQAYGNTTGAYNFGEQWYRAGQGLHFGIDLSMPCGTPLVAVADGYVQFVSDESFGSAPHNLILLHSDVSMTTLYGHLLEEPRLMPGQFVQQGEVIALSGDPDLTCDSRPHLHFEVRSTDYSRTINPASVINANWQSLALIGPFSFPLFQQNLFNPRQWLTLDNQPDVYFWGKILNQYEASYPLKSDVRPATTPIASRTAPPITSNTAYTLRQLTTNGCCALPQWYPTNPNQFFTVDGGAEVRAGVFQWDATNGESVRLRPAPATYITPDGEYEMEPFINGTTKIRAVDGSVEVNVETQGRMPTANATGNLLLWTVNDNQTIPGQTRPQTRIYMSQINGENTREIIALAGADARWMDDENILISVRDDRRQMMLYVYDLTAERFIELGQWREMRGLSVSPGGRYVMFYISWQADASGVYVIDMESPFNAVKMPWFGAWRWRDNNTLYYIPFEPNTLHHTLRTYNIESRQDNLLLSPQTAPFTIAEGYWEVNADGTRILFQNAADRNLYMLEPDQP